MERAALPARGCGRCGGVLEWESIREWNQERWLGVCADCGWLVAFLPDQPRVRPRDPLRVFVLGTGATTRPETPPWIRVFRVGSTMPWNVHWVHSPYPCARCGTHVTFSARTLPRPGVVAHCLLCLGCGRATVEHVRPGSSLRETPVCGDTWSPPDVAVARLREAVFRPSWRQYEDVD